MSKKGSPRRTLLIMVAVFAVPYALAWYLYTNPQVLDLGSRSNGTLINPLIAPHEVTFVHQSGEAYPAQPEGEKKWSLLMFGPSQCGADCEKTLFTLQQLRKMLAVEKARLRRAYVLVQGVATQGINTKLAQYQGTELFIAESGNIGLIEQKLGIEAGDLEQHIVIADPMGNLVMLYPRDIDPKKIFADIEILFGRVKGV